MPFGFIRDFCAYARSMTDAPENYHEYVALALLGAACGNRVYWRTGVRKSKLHLWILFIGPSTTSHKSESVVQGLHILNSTKPDCQLPDDYNYERLVEHLTRNPTGVLWQDEFGRLLDHVQRDYMRGTEKFLTSLFDMVLPYKRAVGNSLFEIIEPSVTFLGCSTTEWLAQNEATIKGGFMGRFLIVSANSQPNIFTRQKAEDIQEKNLLVHKLRQVFELNGECHWVDSSEKLYDEEYLKWHARFKTCTNPMLATFHSRLLNSYALKLCALCQIDQDKELGIGPKAVIRAWQYIQNIASNLENFAENDLTTDKYQRTRKKVLDFIRKHTEGVSKSELLVGLRLPVRQLNETLGDLMAEESIVPIQSEKQTLRGFKAQCFKAVFRPK